MPSSELSSASDRPCQVGRATETRIHAPLSESALQSIVSSISSTVGRSVRVAEPFSVEVSVDRGVQGKGELRLRAPEVLEALPVPVGDSEPADPVRVAGEAKAAAGIEPFRRLPGDPDEERERVLAIVGSEGRAVSSELVVERAGGEPFGVVNVM